MANPGAVAQTGTYPNNAATCQQCHSVPSKFGSSQLAVQRIGAFTEGKFIPGREGGIRHRHGETEKPSGVVSSLIGERVTISLFGDGYIEAIPSHDIEG